MSAPSRRRPAPPPVLWPAVLLLAATLALPAAAQSTGGIVVAVQDDDGPLPGASVTISSPQQRLVATTTELTDDGGIARFPVLKPGSGYVIEVSFPGYATVRFDARIRASATPSRTVVLRPQMEERIIVEDAARNLIELDDTRTSTKFNDEFIQDLPVVGRFYQNVLTFAPGVQDPDDDGNPVVHGSRSRDLRAVVGGVSNVDPLTGQFRSNVNPNSIEEMEVITAGAGPEWGRAQGGYVNIIQKQGGNRFEGVAEFLFRSSRFDGDGATDVRRELVPDFEWQQPSLQVSGPIVRDKLWFRLSHEWIDREDPFNTGTRVQIVTRREQINADQLTWQVSERNKLAFRFDSNPVTVENFGISGLVAEASTQRLDNEGETYSVVWSAPHSPRLFVESVVAWQDGGFSETPTTQNVANNCFLGPRYVVETMCRNRDYGTTTGSHWRDFDDRRQRFTVRSDATWYAPKKFLGANHQLKFGFIIENERYFRTIQQGISTDFFIIVPGEEFNFQTFGRALINLFIPQAQTASARGTAWGLYLRDQIKPLPNLTLDVGFRLDREQINALGRAPLDPAGEFEEYLARVADGEAQGLPTSVARQLARITTFTAYEAARDLEVQFAEQFDMSIGVAQTLLGPVVGQAAFQQNFRGNDTVRLRNTNLSPFLAASWDPGSDGKTKIAFTWGRHYNNTPLAIPTYEFSPVLSTIEVIAPRFLGDFYVPPLEFIGRKINPTATVQTVRRDLRTPYQDEFTATFQRELWSETALTLSYIQRRYRDQFQDRDINNVPRDFGTCTPVRRPGDSPIDLSVKDGLLDDCVGQLSPIIVEDPNTGRPNVVGVPSPDGLLDLYKLNPFWGSILEIGNYNSSDYEAFVLEFRRRQFRGWELQGSYTWSMSQGNGEDFTQLLGDDQSLTDDEFGFQASDQRHVFKLVGTTITPWGLRLGGSATWQSGLPYSLLTSRLVTDELAPALGAFGNPEPRNRLLYKTGVRNSERNRSYWNFDLKASREFVFGRRFNMQVSLEVFNVLNDGTYTIYNPFEELGSQVNGANDAYRRFGRRFQLSSRLSF